jgi:hypothetical protein
MRKSRKFAALLAVFALSGSAVAPAAFAGGKEPPPPPPKDDSRCNSGNGNGSDAITFVEGEHCFGGDPGNSYNAGNKGGDEIPTSGGEPNPGGNNVP